MYILLYQEASNLNYKSLNMFFAGVTRRNQCLGMSTSSRPYIWGIPHDTEDGRTEECMVGLSAPDCEQAPWTRLV